MSRYLKALELCIEKDERGDSLINKPFFLGEYVFSTDTFIMIRVQSMYVENHLNRFNTKEDLKNRDILINTNDLFNVPRLEKPIIIEENKINFESLKKEVQEYKDCEECAGDGEVEYQYESSKSKSYYLFAKCPICKGDGEIKTNEKSSLIPEDSTIKFKELEDLGFNSHYSTKYIQKLFEISKVLNYEPVRIMAADNKKALFKIGEATILLGVMINVEEPSFIYL